MRRENIVALAGSARIAPRLDGASTPHRAAPAHRGITVLPRFDAEAAQRPTVWWSIMLSAMLFLSALTDQAIAHGLDDSDAAFVAGNRGPQFSPFLYLGAKHEDRL